MFRSTLAVLAFAVVGTAVAQTPSAPAPAPAAAPAATTATPPPHKCGKPDDHPGRLASDQRRRGWEKEVQTWQACMKDYIGGLQAKADQQVKEANAAVAESNAAIAAYNEAVKALQVQVEAMK